MSNVVSKAVVTWPGGLTTEVLARLWSTFDRVNPALTVWGGTIVSLDGSELPADTYFNDNHDRTMPVLTMPDGRTAEFRPDYDGSPTVVTVKGSGAPPF